MSALRIAQKDMPRSAARLLLSLELRAAGDEETRYEVLRSVVLSSDIVVASEAAAANETLELPAHRLAMAGTACMSKYATIRAVVLRTALRAQDPSAQRLVRSLVRDPSASVRAIALNALPDWHDEAIAEARRVLRSDRARKRAVALDVLCTLGADDATALCEMASADPAVAVLPAPSPASRLRHRQRWRVRDSQLRAASRCRFCLHEQFSFHCLAIAILNRSSAPTRWSASLAAASMSMRTQWTLPLNALSRGP